VVTEEVSVWEGVMLRGWGPGPSRDAAPPAEGPTPPPEET
jgi:hypothetical protein